MDISHVDPLDEEELLLYCEFFQGATGDKEPVIDMYVDEEVWRQVIDSVNDLPGVRLSCGFLA